MKVLVPWFRYPPWDEQVIGGLSVPLWNLTQEMGHQGVSIDVLIPAQEEEEEERTVGTVRVLQGPLGNAFVSDRPRRLLADGFLDEYDAVLSVNNVGASLLAAGSISERVVRQLHTVLTVQPPSYGLSLARRPIERPRAFILKRRYERKERTLRGTRSICVSRHLGELAVKHRIEHPENIRIVPLGVHLDQFRPAHAEPRVDLLCIAKFRWVKGLDLLLRALTALQTRGIEPTLGLVGSYADRERRYLLGFVPETVRSRIQFLGPIPNDHMGEVLNGARLVVIPSRYETFSLVALESIACGVPVVAFRVGALEELVEPSMGVLVDRVNAEELTRGIRQALSNPALRESARLAGPSKARQFDWGIVARDTIAVLRETPPEVTTGSWNPAASLPAREALTDAGRIRSDQSSGHSVTRIPSRYPRTSSRNGLHPPSPLSRK